MADEKEQDIRQDPIEKRFKEQEKRYEEIRGKEEEEFVKRVSKKFGLPYIDLTGTVIDTDALILLNEKEARLAQVAPFKLRGKELHVAVRSPNLIETKGTLRKLEEKGYDLVVYIASTRSLEKAWARYADVDLTHTFHGGLLDINQENIRRISLEIHTNKDIAREFREILESESKTKTTEILELIFGSAIATKTSDVHFEPQEDKVRLRFRQDGVLQDIVSFPHEIYKKLLSRIKLLSKMKITQTRNAQDGRFTIDFDGKEIEVRVSVIPSAYGESFVMRILNPDGINVGLDQLGIEPKLYEILQREIRKPNGMILTTGPTGSGKTTTLYSILKEVYTPEVKILTIEDPVEYHLEGIAQTQVDREKGYDFLAGLRAALRQDPDIIMVGEIRDHETATIAVNASLTGHLVLSTLHTNSAAGVIPRLIDLGIAPQILAAALSLSLAQRLVRKVCTHCAYTYTPSEEEERIIRDILKRAAKNNKPLADHGMNPDQEIILTKGRGCDVCNGTGYKGRVGIFEAIVTDELIEELLNKRPSEQEVRRVAEKQGLFNMQEDGVVKVLEGITSLEEVQSVVDLDIRNITQLDSEEGENGEKEEGGVVPIHREEEEVVEEKVVRKAQALAPEKTEEHRKSHSREIALLLDYLHILEREQQTKPGEGIAEKIRQVKESLVDLLEEQYAEEHFGGRSKEEAKEVVKPVLMQLDQLAQEQEEKPEMPIPHKLRQVREEIQLLSARKEEA